MTKPLKEHLRDKCFVISGHVSQENAKEAVKLWLTEKYEEILNHYKMYKETSAEQSAKMFYQGERQMIDELLEDARK